MEYEVCVEGIQLQYFSEFKYFGVCFEQAGDIRSLVNFRGLQLECTRILHESFLIPILMYGRRRRGLGIELYRWTNSKVCRVSGE